MAVAERAVDRRYTELLLYLPAGWELLDAGRGVAEQAWWPARLLKRLGSYVHEHSTWLGPNDTVAVSEPGESYAPGTLVSGALLLAPRVEPEGFDPLIIDGVPCRFLWVFPVTEAELQLKLERGTDALLELIGTKDVGHVLDAGRACMVTGRRPGES
jgi:hypothetical protein